MRLEQHPDDDDWETILWRRDASVVASATCEPYYLAGGPPLYHDSYTTSLVLDQTAVERLIAILREVVPAAGGVIEDVLDLGAQT